MVPGVNEAKSRTSSTICYLISMRIGLVLWGSAFRMRWRTCPTACLRRILIRHPAPARKPGPSNSRADWVKPSRYQAIAISHTHPDHIVNVRDVPYRDAFVHKADYDAAPIVRRSSSQHPSPSSRAIATVLATAACRSVHAWAHAGPPVLLGSCRRTRSRSFRRCVHFKSNWENRGVPSNNVSKEAYAGFDEKSRHAGQGQGASLEQYAQGATATLENVAPAFYE